MPQPVLDTEKVIAKGIISAQNLARILEYLQDVDYGTVTLVIQDKKVIRVEKTVKIKLC
ncbi:MAG: YezD family protein [Clostridiales bacterium]|nr:YezD family protein [Clostridiales bacterium]MDR2752371.1 YezD family protein [Clostridiales bacterium]